MFSIIVTDALTGCKTELCRVGSNPEAIAEAAKDKTIHVGKRSRRRYCAVEIVNLEAPGTVIGRLRPRTLVEIA
jgi:hypothetical protein